MLKIRTLNMLLVLLLFLPGLAVAQNGYGDSGEYTILSAQYGTGARHVDVTNRLRQLAQSDRSFRMGNSTFGVDPARGQVKVLRIYAEVQTARNACSNTAKVAQLMALSSVAGDGAIGVRGDGAAAGRRRIKGMNVSPIWKPLCKTSAKPNGIWRMLPPIKAAIGKELWTISTVPSQKRKLACNTPTGTELDCESFRTAGSKSVFEPAGNCWYLPESQQ